MHFSSLNTLHLPRPCHPCCVHQPDNICWGVQIIKLRIVQCLPFAYSRFPLRPKYPSQCLGLEHSQPTFLPQYETKLHTHTIQQSYTSVYFNLYIFGKQMGRDNTIMAGIVAAIVWLQSAINFFMICYVFTVCCQLTRIWSLPHITEQRQSLLILIINLFGNLITEANVWIQKGRSARKLQISGTFFYSSPDIVVGD
jgi:hypothetical protein